VVPSLASSELQAQLVHDRPRDLVLNGEDVLQLSIETRRPEWNVIGDAHELGVHAQPPTGSEHRSLYNQIRSESITDVPKIARLVFECERGGLRLHLQALNH